MKTTTVKYKCLLRIKNISDSYTRNLFGGLDRQNLKVTYRVQIIGKIAQLISFVYEKVPGYCTN